ncbi:HEAT repeat domain-containing protein [Myxococcota bacterium]|nr:HEAT repeat domain-containing protein [Myxococcota bacterium]
MVQLSGDPALDLLRRIAREGRDEAGALRDFEDLVALGAGAVPALAGVYADPAAPGEERWVAARALGRIGGGEALRALKEGLARLPVLDRLAAATALGDLRDPAAAADLAAALADPALAVRICAADALAALGPRAPFDALARALERSGEPAGGRDPLRTHLVAALGATGDPRALGPLVEALDDPDPEVRAAALRSLPSLARGAGRVSPPSGTEGAERWKAWWAESGGSPR